MHHERHRDILEPTARSSSSAREKLVPTLPRTSGSTSTALLLEDARAQAAYGQHSLVGKILEIHQELPGRIHIVLIRRSGF